MVWASFLEILLIAVMGIAGGTGLFVLAAYIARPKRQTARELLAEVEERAALLFDEGDLLDANAQGRLLLDQVPDHGSDLDRVLTALEPGFPTISDRLAILAYDQKIRIDGTGPATDQVLEAEFWNDLVRITVASRHSKDRAIGAVDAVAIGAMEAELDVLRALSEDSPHLMWHMNSDGDVTWANQAYQNAIESISGNTSWDGGWPIPKLFEQIKTAPAHGEASLRRVAIRAAGGHDDSSMWFEVTSRRRGTGSVHFASDANGLVRAEKAQRDFVQTLTKTFAGLNIGMVVFDNHRRLVLFNPAFLDMTGLKVDFLSMRPLIESVLDRLRELNVLPEPRDYASWRDQMVALEAGAKDGTYSETWSLPGGQTLRVTGRPHPGGAIAFMFEDISTEVSLTRRFKSELEFGQSVIDNIEEGVVVFSGAGTQIATNDVYDRLWNNLTPASLVEIRVHDAIQHWRNMCVPTSIWRDLQEFLMGGSEPRGEWAEEVQMVDGRHLFCRFVPLPGRATLVTFRVLATKPRSKTHAIASSEAPLERQDQLVFRRAAH